MLTDIILIVLGVAALMFMLKGIALVFRILVFAVLVLVVVIFAGHGAWVQALIDQFNHLNFKMLTNEIKQIHSHISQYNALMLPKR